MKATVILTAAAWMICSCVGTRYVSVPEYHNIEVVRHDTLVRTDSVLERDSVFVRVQGDTVFRERYSIRYRDRLVERVVCRDSIRVDSVRVPYPVERPLTFWQRTELHLFKVLAVLMGVILTTLIIRMVWRRMRNNVKKL